MQHKLSEGPLHNEQGRLSETGYATSLVKAYDRARIAAGKMHIKEWDYYAICSPDAVLALTIADNGYMGLDSVTLIDVPMRWERTKTFMRLLPLGKTALPSSSKQGVTEIKGKGYHLRFENDGVKRTLTADIENFFLGKPLTASVMLTDEPEDSMVIVTPFANKPKAFYYNQKINCLQAEGQVEFDGVTRAFHKDNSMAVLDWGRGVWTYKNTWYWGSLSGRVNGVPVGLNLGYGFGDTSAASENMLFYDGRAHKLGRLTFAIPQTDDGRDDFMKPWAIEEDDGRLSLTFTPILDRASDTNAIVIESDQHQVFGYYEGKAVLDDGTELEIPRLLGFAEKVKNRW